MSQSTRLFGTMIVTLSIGGTSYIAVCSNFELDWDYETQEARALQDTSRYPIGLIDGWTGTGTFYVSTASTSGEGGPGGTLWTKALAKTQVAVTYKDNGISGAGNTLSGNALITRARQASPFGPLTIDLTLTGQGPLASAIA